MAEPLSRELIVATTRDLIERDGLDAVSLRGVAGALGVTAPALYAYVRDKRDLLQGVAEGQFAALTDRFAAIDDPDPVERIRQSSRVYIRCALDQPELWRTMFLFPPDLGLGPGTGAELPASTKAFETALSAAAEAIELGRFRPADPIMVALTLWTAAHGVADALLLGFGFDDDTIDALVELSIETVIDGLRPRD